MQRLSFSRQILPVIAIVAIIVAAVLIWRGLPDRALAEPGRQPPAAPAGDSKWVAGAGVIEPASELIAVAPQIPGVVERIFVKVGDRVSVGDPLFAIDSRDARAAVAEAEARIARLRASVAAADTSLAVARRQAALYAGDGDPRAFSRQEVITRQGNATDAAAQRDVARAQLREAVAQLESTRVTLARLTVRSAIAGEVLQVRTRPGQFVATGGEGETPMTLGAVDPLHVRIDIDENEIGRVDIGRPAAISAKGDARQRQTVTFVRAEPLVIPKRSLTNASNERVDVRVLQLIYALPPGQARWFVGQQVDGFAPAKAAR